MSLNKAIKLLKLAIEEIESYSSQKRVPYKRYAKLYAEYQELKKELDKLKSEDSV